MIKIDVDSQLGSFHLNHSIELPSRGVTVLFGESGCGKTSTLRALAGLSRLDNCLVSVNDEVWQSKSDLDFVPTHKRSLGYVFQQAALFQHLNVKANIMFGMHSKSLSHEQQLRFEQLVNLLGLEHILERGLSGLSGGEKQRVAIARSLLPEPSVLLMDEPLSALDEQRKSEVMPFLESLAKECSVPIIYVTHSVSEVIKLADHVVVMSKGMVVKQGSVEVCLPYMTLGGSEPRSVLKMHVMQHSEDGVTELGKGDIRLWMTGALHHEGQVRCEILASDVSITKTRALDSSVLNILPATIERFEETNVSGEMLVEVRLISGDCIRGLITRRSITRLGLAHLDKVWVQIKAIAIL